MTNKVLSIAAAAEVVTGVGLLVVPSVVAHLLLGHDLLESGVLVARVAGAALVGLGTACWPGPPLAGMLAYGVLVTVCLGHAGATGTATGPLLWPAVGLHAVLSVVLLSSRRGASGQGRS